MTEVKVNKRKNKVKKLMSKAQNREELDNTNDKGVSLFARSLDITKDDPLEEIFALNLGDFLCENLINEELAGKISNKKDRTESLKEQLKELISIYSIDSTLSLLGFRENEDYIIYDSVARAMKLMLALTECNIYLSTKHSPLKLAGTSVDNPDESIKPEIRFAFEKEKIITIKEGGYITKIFPMKNNFECIGSIEIKREIDKPLEAQYENMIKITAGLFVTSLGIQKLIDEVQKVINNDIVSTSELQNLRAQLTAIIGDLQDQQQAFVEAMASAVDLKSRFKNNHSKDVAELSREICKTIGLNEKTTDLIYYAGLLQNIGKITLNEKLFTKKDKLTKEEWDKIQEYPNAGVGLLMNINFLSEVIPYIYYQKERWDGTGHPEGLKGMSIPFGSRIIALADAYCALTQDRSHRKALSNKEALEILKSECGTKWDKTVYDALYEIKGEN